MSQTAYKVIVMEGTTGQAGVAVMYPTGELPIEELIRRHVNTSRPYQVMGADELPNVDGDFYDAWVLAPCEDEEAGYKVVVDVERAREVHRKNLRMERKPLLEALDVQFMRAVERVDTAAQQEIAAKKQALRDLPDHAEIAAAATTARLRALTLDVLTGNAPMPVEPPAETAETPAEIAEAPAENAEPPAETAEAPAETAETPAETAETPAETPAETAETPAENAETPAETAETPAETAETPAEIAEAPAETPAETAETPAENAETPAETAETPAENAEISAETAEAPAETPADV